jgi:hypothetical protein
MQQVDAKLQALQLLRSAEEAKAEQEIQMEGPRREEGETEEARLEAVRAAEEVCGPSPASALVEDIESEALEVRRAGKELPSRPMSMTAFMRSYKEDYQAPAFCFDFNTEALPSNAEQHHAQPAATRRDERIKVLRQVFDAYDVRGSGILEPAQYSQLLQDMGLAPKTIEESHRLVSLIGEARGGRPGPLSFQQFVSFADALDKE